MKRIVKLDPNIDPIRLLFRYLFPKKIQNKIELNLSAMDFDIIPKLKIANKESNRVQ